MDCAKCGVDPCECQRALVVSSSTRQVPQKYDFRKCSNPQCTVMVGFLVGSAHGLTECKWCQAGVAYWQRGR